ncbi:MAG: hypothetical protein JHC98_02990 [Thermoleophilaceae bacterium]|nr:hypothetical protein [Thermoleophilaceae bacterium]
MDVFLEHLLRLPWWLALPLFLIACFPALGIRYIDFLERLRDYRKPPKK